MAERSFSRIDRGAAWRPASYCRWPRAPANLSKPKGVPPAMRAHPVMRVFQCIHNMANPMNHAHRGEKTCLHHHRQPTSLRVVRCSVYAEPPSPNVLAVTQMAIRKGLQAGSKPLREGESPSASIGRTVSLRREAAVHSFGWYLRLTSVQEP